MGIYTGIALVCFSGGLLSGMAGFGALILIVPGLILLLDMETAVSVGVLCGIATQTLNAVINRAPVDKKVLLLMIFSAFPGIAVGIALLTHLPETALRAARGALLIIYVAWTVSGKLRPPSRPPSAIWTVITGFSSGAFGGAFGINGPPVVLYLTRTGWAPGTMRSFMGIFCTLLFLVLTAALFTRGFIDAETMRYAAAAIPSCLLGGGGGYALARRFRPDQYMRLVFALLFIMGISLCWPALRAVFSS